MWVILLTPFPQLIGPAMLQLTQASISLAVLRWSRIFCSRFWAESHRVGAYAWKLDLEPYASSIYREHISWVSRYKGYWSPWARKGECTCATESWPQAIGLIGTTRPGSTKVQHILYLDNKCSLFLSSLGGFIFLSIKYALTRIAFRKITMSSQKQV